MKMHRKLFKNILLDVCIVVLVIAIIACGYEVYHIVSGYLDDRNTYSDLRTSVTATGGGRFHKDIDWDKLHSINSDVVGWIYLEDSNIDYPIVKGCDNDEYLHTLFDGSYGNAGTVFVDSNTDNPFEQFNTIVYGHHMKDGSMFNNLKLFKDKGYADKYPCFELYTPENNYYLEVAAFLNCPSDSEIYASNIGESCDSKFAAGKFNNSESSDVELSDTKSNVAASKSDWKMRRKYINQIEKEAKYLTDISISEDDRLVLLSTCAYEYEGARYVVVCKIK